MPAEEITRILFRDFSGWAIGVFYVVAVAALAIFFHGCYVLIRKYRHGASAPGARFDLLGLVRTMLAHRTLKRRDSGAGHAHAAIFFGFGLLFIGTLTITLEYDILEPLFGVKFWHGDFYLWFSLVLDIAGAGLIVGLLYMMVRRKWLAPPKLDYARPDRAPDEPDYDRSGYRREDWLFLHLLLLIAVTGFLLEAARLVWLQADPAVWPYRWWSPVGAALAAGLAPWLEPAAAGGLRTSLWWLHAALALGLIALIPRTKAKHMFTAMASLGLRDARPAARLPKADLEADAIGYNKITDLTWKHLLHLDACTKCGRCHEACPANATGFPLSPRDVILSLRELAENALSGPSPTAAAIGGDGPHELRAETLWSCRTCAACVEICPVGIEHIPIIVEARRNLVEAGELDPLLQTTLKNIEKKGNSFNENRRKRPAWAKKLDFEIPDARKEAVDVLWFVGDFASFDPRYQRVSRLFAKILRHCGVRFGILREAEISAGNDVRRVGEEGLYEHQATTNIETLAGCDFKRIVTTDPHSYNTIKNEFPDFGGNYPILHAAELLSELIDAKTLTFERPLGRRVTYHDPCHLGRLNGVFDAPRKVLKAAGVELVEMERSRDNSFCCGGGGGRIWMADPPDQQKPSENRLEEAAGIDGLEVFAVACPKCLNMFEDAVKSTGNEDNFRVAEVIELVAENLGLEDKPPAAKQPPPAADQPAPAQPPAAASPPPTAPPAPPAATPPAASPPPTAPSAPPAAPPPAGA